jgi:hypothetical protein
MSEKRPTTKGVQVHFPRPDFNKVEDWRRGQREIPSLAAAVRALVALGIEASAADGKRLAAKDSAA